MNELKVRKTYKTRGGWDALVIWQPFQSPWSIDTGYYAIHKPGTQGESTPMWHQGNGRVADCVFGVNVAPHYKGHPADIVKEKSGK